MKTKTMGYNNQAQSENWIYATIGGCIGLFKYVKAQLMDIHLQPDMGSILLNGFLTAAITGAGAWLGKEVMSLAYKHIKAYLRRRRERKRNKQNP